MRTQRRKAVGFAVGPIAVLAAALALLPGCGGEQKTQNEGALRGVTRSPALQVGEVKLPDVSVESDGRASALTPPSGQLRLVYFGYTGCPDVCPTTMVDVRAALQRLPRADRNRVTMSMVTVDPKRDTARKLNGYLSHFFADWRVYRTTSTRELARAERAFHASHKAGRPNRHGSYDVSHTAQVYAVAPNGRVLVEWPFGSQPADIGADLKVLLSRPLTTTTSTQRIENNHQNDQGGST